MIDNQQFHQDFTDYTNNSEDFGFTAMDAAELAVKSPQSFVTQPSTQEVVSDVSNTFKKNIENIESRLTEIMQKIANISNFSSLPQKTDLLRIEEKIDKTLNIELKQLSTDIGQSENNIRSIIDEVEERKQNLYEIYKNKMMEIEKLILPLCYNLMKNPQKEYIYWPNRVDALNKQISKIIFLTKSEIF